ncbi:hypothetical protein HN51_026910 [Arachis hypogaea]
MELVGRRRFNGGGGNRRSPECSVVSGKSSGGLSRGGVGGTRLGVRGIYDGFNDPDAPDYLLSNLYNTTTQCTRSSRVYFGVMGLMEILIWKLKNSILTIGNDDSDTCAGWIDQQNNNNMNDEDRTSCAVSGGGDSNFDDHGLKRKKRDGNGSGNGSSSKNK